MVPDLLARPAVTVLATVRDPQASTSRSLHDLPGRPAASRLVVAAVDEDVTDHAYRSIAMRAAKAGINHLDVVMANAGASRRFDWVLDTDADDVRRCFEANSIGPLKLFQACWPILDKGDGGAAGKKFVLVTSAVGSVAGLEKESFPTKAYSMSKAGANWLAKRISFEFVDKGLSVGIIHPGWVETDMGQYFADTVGLVRPPMTVQESSRLVLEQVDGLSLATTPGMFIASNGRERPW